MNKRPDIWRQLQDHEIPPPADLTAHVLGMAAMGTAPDEADQPLARLRDHSIMPPAALQTGIEKKLGLKPGRSLTPKKIIAIGSAAAALAAIIFGIAHFTQPHPAGSAPGYTSAAKPAAAGQDSIPHTSTAQDSAANNALAADDPAAAADDPAKDTDAAAKDTDAASHSRRPFVASAARINGQPLQLTNNDLLMTFTAFKYPAAAALSGRNMDAAWKIHVDQYTNITLSRAMSQMLKDLYQARANGKPTRHARKTKERLEDWRTRDESHFDRSPLVNAIDPLDLAAFLNNPGSKPATAASQTGQPALPATAQNPDNKGDLTVSYQIAIASKKDNGIAETYNGGIKTLFVKEGQARIRLVSLMRIQSVYATMNRDRLQSLALLKESGKHPGHRLDAAQMTAYEQKYTGAACRLTADSMRILQYDCRKAQITTRDGRQLTAWYTPALHKNAAGLLEPLFEKIPGLVLRYETTIKRKTVTYTATSLSRRPIREDIFLVP